MFKKTSITITLVASLILFFLPNPLWAWPHYSSSGGLGLFSPYEICYDLNGHLDGDHEVDWRIEIGAIEWEGPNGQSTIQGLSGVNYFVSASNATETVDPISGQITLCTEFPYLRTDCRNVPDCKALISDDSDDGTYDYREALAFLLFYGIVDPDVPDEVEPTIDDVLWFKKNWFPRRAMVLTSYPQATETRVLNESNTLEGSSPLAGCIAVEETAVTTYRTFYTTYAPDEDLDEDGFIQRFQCNEEDQPFTIGDLATLKKDEVTVYPLSNDIDLEEDYPLTAELVDQASDGVATLNDDYSFTYTKGETFIDEDCFSYRAIDSEGNLGNVAEVCIRSFK